MFTGLVQAVGTVVEVLPRRGSVRVSIRSGLPVAEMREGESVAVDGVCLTVAAREDDRFSADVVAETLSRSTFARLKVGDRVNLERSLRMGEPLGGHLMAGHVDATVIVRAVRRRGDDWRLVSSLEPAIRRYVAEKGSVALQGVSLTVASVRPREFEVALIPETLSRTNLGAVRPGHHLNVEADLLARYLERLMATRAGGILEGRLRRPAPRKGSKP